MNIRKTWRKYQSAMKAGWIASRCKTGCYLDDKNEVVVSCIFHRAEITRLEEINKEACV